MTKIIFNADDFGLSKGMNYGIIDSFKFGMLKSTTLMITMNEVDHAIELFRENPKLDLGLHLNISLGKPLTVGKSLVDEDGLFIKPKFITNDEYVMKEVYEEFLAQWNLFVAKVGKEPTHLDSHLFSHQTLESIRSAAVKLANEKNIFLRDIEINSLPKVKFFWSKLFNVKLEDYKGLDFLYDYIHELKKYEVVEVMTHPGYLDPYVQDTSSFTTGRVDDLRSLISPNLKGFLEDNKCIFISFEELIKK